MPNTPMSPRLFILKEEVPGYVVQLQSCDTTPEGIAAARAVAVTFAQKFRAANPNIKNQFFPFPNLEALTAYEVSLPAISPAPSGTNTSA